MPGSIYNLSRKTVGRQCQEDEHPAERLEISESLSKYLVSVD